MTAQQTRTAPRTQTPANPQPLFSLGQTVATPGAIDALAEAYGNRWRLAAHELLTRHQTGDWGDIDPADRGANERSLAEGTRLLSVYRLRALTPNTRPVKVWIITEWDRSATTLLLPEEY